MLFFQSGIRHGKHTHSCHGCLSFCNQTYETLRAVFLAIAMHPDAQRKAQEEIDRVVGNDRLPQLSDREHLPYVAAVVKETSRWHSVVPLGTFFRAIWLFDLI